MGLRRGDRGARSPTTASPWLDAPVKRVASTDTFVGYAPQLEDAILPQVEDFKQAYADLDAGSSVAFARSSARKVEQPALFLLGSRVGRLLRARIGR